MLPASRRCRGGVAVAGQQGAAAGRFRRLFLSGGPGPSPLFPLSPRGMCRQGSGEARILPPLLDPRGCPSVPPLTRRWGQHLVSIVLRSGSAAVPTDPRLCQTARRRLPPSVSLSLRLSSLPPASSDVRLRAIALIIYFQIYSPPSVSFRPGLG